MPIGGRKNIFMCRRCGKESDSPICPKCMREAQAQAPDQEGIPLPQEGQLIGWVKQTKDEMETIKKTRTAHVQKRTRPKRTRPKRSRSKKTKGKKKSVTHKKSSQKKKSKKKKR